MPEIKNTFTQGKMNKDLDERIIPNGQYRDAMNIQVSTSEGADVGAVQNILGNIRVEGVIGGGWSCVGAISDEKNDRFFWFITNPVRDAIFEYKTNGTITPVIIDTSLDVLNFQGNIITGINIVDDILLWTDNHNEPRKINIERCKLGVDTTNPISTHTKLVINGVVTSEDITEEHITVIKKRPSVAPIIKVNKTGFQQTFTSVCDFSQGSETIDNYNSTPFWSGAPSNNPDNAGGDGLSLVEIGDSAFVRIRKVAGSYSASIAAEIKGELIAGVLDSVSMAQVHDFSGNNSQFTTDPFSPGNYTNSNLPIISRLNFTGGVYGGIPDVSYDTGNQRVILDNLKSFTPVTGIQYNWNGNMTDTKTQLNVKFFEDAVTGPYSYTDEHHWSPGDELRISFDWYSDDTTPKTLTISLVDWVNGAPDTGFGINWVELTRHDFVSDGIASTTESFSHDFYVPTTHSGGLIRGRVYNGSASLIGDINEDWIDNFNMQKVSEGFQNPDYYQPTDTIIVPNTTNINPGDLVDVHQGGFGSNLHVYTVTAVGNDYEIELSNDPDPSVYTNILASTYQTIPIYATAADTWPSNATSWGLIINIANFEVNAPYSVSDILLLSQPSSPGSLPNNHEARGEIINIYNQLGTPGFTEYEIEIISLNSTVPTTKARFNTAPNPNTPGLFFRQGADMNVVKEIDISPLFEEKFGRFATRWKYEDGEYSAFSPFTDVAFNAAAFQFHPTKNTYNLGMENNCQDIEILDFITPDIPEDVVQVDILIKPENSTTVYSLESIKSNDPLGPGALTNNWNDNTATTREVFDGTNVNTTSLPTAYKGKYIMSADNIHAALPSNQLLRPWDNVPKKALAQEITGNRVVYGNYTQGYNMLDGTTIVKPFLNLTYRQRSINTNDTLDFQSGKKSLKTFRTYQLGVVFGDEYGRETPVFTSENNSLKIPWDSDNTSVFNGNASRSIQLQAKLYGDTPDFAKYYKFFIKQNLGEYYNLSMDRVYRAEDNENLWISFPSSDINKIQKDEYIILKKKAETEEQVETNNKFKVIDIKNEVPEWIKFKRTQIGNIGGSLIIQSLFPGYTNSINIPQENENQIVINKDIWINNGGTALTDMDKDFEFLEMQFTTLSGTAVIESKRYRIIGIELINSDEEYRITLGKLISNADNWVTTTPNSGIVDPNLRIKILKIIPRVSASEFQGRFFVKIISNNITQTYLEPLIGVETLYRVNGVIPTHNFADTQALANAAHTDGIVNSVSTQNIPTQLTFALHNSLKSNTQAAWEKLFEYGAVGVTEGWFIDHAYFASVQPIDLSDPTGKTGFLETNISGRMTKGGSGSGGSNGGDFVDSCMGMLNIEGITAYNSTSDPTVESGWGVRTWSYLSRGQNNAVPIGSGTNENTYDDIYDNSAQDIAYMHLSFGPVGDDLWIGSTNSNIFPSSANSTNFDWQDINTGTFGHGFFNGNTPEHLDQWKIKDPDLKDTANKLQAGAKFKIANNEEVFTIDKVSVKRLYNHTPFMITQKAWDGTQAVDLENSIEYFWNEWDNNSFNTSTIGNNGTIQQNLADALVRFGHKSNRRLLYILKLDKDPGDYGISFTWDADSTHSLRFIEEVPTDEESGPLVSPAIWETEQKEDTDLNIYYEASNAIPIKQTNDIKNTEMLIPIGSEVWCSKSNSVPLFSGASEGLKLIVTNIEMGSSTANIIEFASPGLNVNPSGGSGAITNDQTGWDAQSTEYFTKILRFFREDGSYTSAKIASVKEIIGNYITKVSIYNTNHGRGIGLSYYDCFCFGNGVESNRIRDDFNGMTIGKGVKASATLEKQYKEENRKHGLIYSGIYNSTSGINNLNQFIQAEKITKDLNPTYGSIQKLFQRRIDLVSFCEDRVVKVISNKDALYNADGNSQLVSTNRVLGEANPFVGDYGISKNPESFAKESYRAYFTDKQRGAVLRLSMDGLTPISDAGMSDYFKDNLRNADNIIGSYDSYKGDYNLTLISQAGSIISRGVGSLQDFADAVTISYDEKVKGWSSFKSFIPEFGLSMANDYYTFNEGRVWRHHEPEENGIDRNTFYDDNLVASTITTILNGQPQLIKSYNTINYEGNEGWSVVNITTDQQRGTVLEFIEKEGKWFNYIRGTNEVDLRAFNFQGIGQTTGIEYSI